MDIPNKGGKMIVDDNLFDRTVRITGKYTGLKVDIWSRWCGDKEPTIIIGNIDKNNNYIVIATISPTPQILDKTSNITEEQMENILEGLNYIARNYDLFLKHYTDPTGQFSDDELLEELIKRGDYKSNNVN